MSKFTFYDWHNFPRCFSTLTIKRRSIWKNLSGAHLHYINFQSIWIRPKFHECKCGVKCPRNSPFLFSFFHSLVVYSISLNFMMENRYNSSCRKRASFVCLSLKEWTYEKLIWKGLAWPVQGRQPWWEWISVSLPSELFREGWKLKFLRNRKKLSFFDNNWF